MNEKISVIICTKNRMHDVIRCLESISLQSMLPDEVVIVDSSHTEELKYELNAFQNLNINYIHTEPGLTLQRNIGIKASSGDIIVFSDDDMIWDKDYLKEIMRVFDDYPAEKIGGVTGNVIAKEDVKEIEGIKKFLILGERVFATIFFLPRYGNGRFQPSGMHTTTRKDVDDITKCEVLYGGSMSFRRGIFSEFMFDENFHGHSWGEDGDIGYRVSRKYQNFYTPHAKIVHNDYSPSTSGNKYATMKTTIENHYYLFKKNLPQDFKHKFAFWWSVVGLFVREGITMVVRRNSNGIRGLTNGFINILWSR